MCNVFKCLFLSVITQCWNVWQMHYVIILILCILYLKEYISSIFCIFKSDSLAYEKVTVLKVCIAGLWLTDFLTDSTHMDCVLGAGLLSSTNIPLLLANINAAVFPLLLWYAISFVFLTLPYNIRGVWTFSMTLAIALLLCMFLGMHGFNTQLVIEPQPNFDVEKVSMSFQLFGLCFNSFWGYVA